MNNSICFQVTHYSASPLIMKLAPPNFMFVLKQTFVKNSAVLFGV